MEKIRTFFFVFIVFIFSSLLLAKTINAQENKIDKLNVILNELDSDDKNVYVQYSNFSNKISKTTDTSSLKTEFITNVNTWKNLFESSETIYQKYTSESDTSIANVANLALESTQIGLQAVQKYNSALSSDTSANFTYYADQGDSLWASSLEKHNNAIDQYNLLADNYNKESGVTDAFAARTWLIIASVFFSLISIFLFFKSRVRSSLQAEKIRASVFQNMFANSLAMSAGMIITTAGYAYAVKNGGTYYILWGPVVFGGWRFLTGLANYFGNGRKTLNQLLTLEESQAKKPSLTDLSTNTTKNHTKDEVVFCTNCGSKLTDNSTTCHNCGYKLHV